MDIYYKYQQYIINIETLHSTHLLIVYLLDQHSNINLKRAVWFFEFSNNSLCNSSANWLIKMSLLVIAGLSLRVTAPPEAFYQKIF